MSNISIILLKENDFGVGQYHFGKKLLYFLFILLILGAAALGWKFFEQYQTIGKMGQLIEKQEKNEIAFQQRIDLYDGRESRILFLENYVKELKQSEQNSNVMYKKHTALFRSNTTKLDELHKFICQIMETQCTPSLTIEATPQQTIQWLEQVSQDFMIFNQSINKFDSRRRSFEEQANTIEYLQGQLVETKQSLSEHMEFLKVNKETVTRLTKKISKATGIKLVKRTKSKRKKTKTGRGGPTILDSLSSSRSRWSSRSETSLPIDEVAIILSFNWSILAAMVFI